MNLENKYCPVCGSIVKDQDKNCDNCGENLTVTETTSEEIITGQIHETSSPVQPVKQEIKPAHPVKYCPDCGSTITAGNNFCPQCGFDFHSAKKVQPKTGTPAKPKQKAKTTQTQKLSLKKQYKFEAWQLIAGFVVIAIICVTVIMSNNRSGNEPAKVPASAVNLQALEEARTFAEANPDDTQGLLRYANILHDAKMLDQAIVYYKKYLAQVPDDPDARIDLGTCYFELKQIPEAVNQMEIAVKKHPEHQLGNFNLGIVNISSGNVDKGIEWLNKTIALNPDNEVGKKAKEFIRQAQSAGGMK